MSLIGRLQEKPRFVKAQVAFLFAAAGTALVALMWVGALSARSLPFGGDASGQDAAVSSAEPPAAPPSVPSVSLPVAPGPQVGERREDPAAPPPLPAGRPVQIEVR